MFLVSHSLELRAREIRSWIPKNPSVAMVIASVYFEWTLCRAIIALSRRPNVEIRQALAHVHGLHAYKEIWRLETEHLKQPKTLPEIVRDWQGVTSAFEARNVLVHGRDRYTANMVVPKIGAALSGVEDLCAYCLLVGVDVNKRLPQRRQKRGLRS